MGKDPSDIRAEIEQTRARVGEEVDALSYKTDVGARTHDLIEEKKTAVRSKIQDITGGITGKASGVAGMASSTASTVGAKAGAVIPDRRQLEAHPLALLAGGFAVGITAGLLIPASRLEEQRIGPLGERVLDTALETGRDALERGKHVVEEAAHAAADTARDRGREEGEDLVSTLQERTGSGGGATATTTAD